MRPREGKCLAHVTILTSEKLKIRLQVSVLRASVHSTAEFPTLPSPQTLRKKIFCSHIMLPCNSNPRRGSQMVLLSFKFSNLEKLYMFSNNNRNLFNLKTQFWRLPNFQIQHCKKLLCSISCSWTARLIFSPMSQRRKRLQW